MKSRPSLAFVVIGFFLHYLPVVYVGGMGAAIAVPRSYFEHFGLEQQVLAQAVLSIGTWALPVFLATCALALPALWMGRRMLLSNTMAVGLGMLASVVYLQISFAASFSSNPAASASFLEALAIGLIPSASSLPNLVAASLALAIAHWLIGRRVAAQTNAA